MQKIIEVEHEGITLKAPHETVVEALLAKLSRESRIFPQVAVGDIPFVGGLWPEQGGWRAAEIRGEDGKPNYDLILVQGEDGKPIVLEDMVWGEYGKEIKGASHLRDGHANTQAMTLVGYDLAAKILELKVRGFADLYLPAIVELNAIWGNLGEHLPKKYFWSSTQDGANYARSQNFETGYSSWSNKSSEFHACVVRRVLR